MNIFYRVAVAVYAFISIIISGVIMISPFGDKAIMARCLDFLGVNLYQSNRYDIVLFIVGFLLFALNISILTSGIKGKRSNKYYCTKNENGVVRISALAIENMALLMSKRFNGVKEAKAKATFFKDKVVIAVKISVLTDVHVPNLCKSIQDRVKESVESSMDILVEGVEVSVDNIHNQQPVSQ